MEHSILIAGYKLDTEKIYEKLCEGLNVYWFGSKKDNSVLRTDKRFKPFIDRYFLNVYDVKKTFKLCIINGVEAEKYKRELEDLEKDDDRFNLKQYLIEHDNNNALVIVKAGAGSGKTFVMTNRLLFLLHTKENFQFKDVVMITFTNKATDSMRHRFIELLKDKLAVVTNIEKRKKYLEWIEEVPQMTISTIHSFFKKIVLEIGPMLGYGTDLRLTGMIYEKRRILRDIIDKRFNNRNEEVQSVIGLPIYEIEGLALQYWRKLENNGMTGYEVTEMDWGRASSEPSKSIQASLINIFEEVEEKYNIVKLETNSISMGDIIHEFNRVRNDLKIKEYITSRYKYIFCDEFQDSDDIQIQTIVTLDKLYDGNLFVVGDIKQSIYRFRGATDSAFKRLTDSIREAFEEKLDSDTYSLSKNYRTSCEILNEIDPIFRMWKNKGYLQYNYQGVNSDILTAQNKEKGIYKQIPVSSKNELKINFKLLIDKIESKKNFERGKSIMVLTRNNKQLEDISAWCKEIKKACLIRERGTFYKSIAVKEFCSLIEALQFYIEPMYLYNLLRTSYCYKRLDFHKISSFNGDNKQLAGYFTTLIKEEYDWDKLQIKLRNKPVMAVILEIIETKKPALNFGARQKDYYLKQDYSKAEALKQAVLDAKQYEADLQKLLQLISSLFSGDFSCISDVCNYLRMKILTDNDEDQAEVRDVKDINPILGSTVHAAKGLEFDYVILPFTNEPFRQGFRSEILVDKETSEVGWKYHSYRDGSEICNDLYGKLLRRELREVIGDETRLLYVAMTRAIKGLYCFTWRNRHNEMIWSDLLPEDKDDEIYL